jgi:comEA protein
MRGSPRVLALGVVSIILLLSAILLRVRDTNNRSAGLRNEREALCVGIEHPEIARGLVCARSADQIILKAMETLNLPRACHSVVLPEDLLPGAHIRLIKNRSRCELGEVSRLVGGERLQAGVGLDINTASADDLTLLPGIGKIKAAAIAKHRENQGAFRTIEDLTTVRGIGPATAEKLRPWVSTEKRLSVGH